MRYIVYISGGMTGVKNYEKHFNDAEYYLKSKGISCINPLNISKDVERIILHPEYGDYMREDIENLIRCSGIYMLKGWRRSKGARLERKIAKTIGLEILYEGEF